MRRLTWLAALAMLAWLSLNLGGQSLWVDEGHTWHDALQPLSMAPAGTTPLYNLIMHGLGRLTPLTEWVMRLPSVLATAAGIVMLAGAVPPARRPYFMLIAAVQPFVYWHAQDARMYAMVFMLAAALAVQVRQLAVSFARVTVGAGARFLICLVLLAYIQPYALLMAPGIFLFWLARRQSLTAWCGAIALLVMLLVPLALGYGGRTLALGRTSAVAPGWDRVLTVAQACYYTGFGYTGLSMREQGISAPIGAMAGAALLAYIGAQVRGGAARAVAIWCVGVPALLSIAATLSGAAIIYPRFLIMIVPGLLLLGGGADYGKWTTRAALFAVAILWLLADGMYHCEPRLQKDDFRSVVACARNVTEAGGTVSCWGAVPQVLRYYEQGSPVIGNWNAVPTLPPAGEHWILLFQRQRSAADQIQEQLLARGYAVSRADWRRFVVLRLRQTAPAGLVSEQPRGAQ